MQFGAWLGFQSITKKIQASNPFLGLLTLMCLNTGLGGRNALLHPLPRSGAFMRMSGGRGWGPGGRRTREDKSSPVLSGWDLHAPWK